MRVTASIVTAWLGIGLGTSAQDLPESPHSEIGYPSPQTALAALRNKPGVTSTEQNGWFVLRDTGENTIWSITSEQHQAYPTAVKRSLVERDGSVHLEMNVQCGASKSVCDQVVRDFQALNDNLRKSLDQ